MPTKSSAFLPAGHFFQFANATWLLPYSSETQIGIGLYTKNCRQQCSSLLQSEKIQATTTYSYILYLQKTSPNKHSQQIIPNTRFIQVSHTQLLHTAPAYRPACACAHGVEQTTRMFTDTCDCSSHHSSPTLSLDGQMTQFFNNILQHFMRKLIL